MNTENKPDVPERKEEVVKWRLSKVDIALLISIVCAMAYTLITAENPTAVAQLLGFFKRSMLVACLCFITTSFLVPILIKYSGDRDGRMLSDYISKFRRPINVVILVVWLALVSFHSLIIWEPNVTLTETPFNAAKVDTSYKPMSKSDIDKLNKSFADSKDVASASVTEKNDAVMRNSMKMFSDVSKRVKSVTKGKEVSPWELN